MTIDRRAFLKAAAVGAFAAGAVPTLRAGQQQPSIATDGSADYTIRIAPGIVELAPNRFISTTLYNDQFPGPLIRLREGRSAVVDVYNDTDTPEQLHWHGQLLPVDVDGSAEEGTPFIHARGHRRIVFTPGPAGLRFYHTHTFAGPDLSAGQYSGQVGAVYIEPRENPGNYDQEIFLVLKEFNPWFTRVADMESNSFVPGQPDTALEALAESSRKASPVGGFELEYRYSTINGRLLGGAEPIRVKTNDRVLLHVINGSATEIRSLALPGHVFHVIALDGNPVPSPSDVPVLWIAPGERVSALVQMSHPGVWLLSDVGDARFDGMGVAVEYAGETGNAEWIDPPSTVWDYARFGRQPAQTAMPDETIEMVFTSEQAAVKGFNRWLINGRAFSMVDMKPAFSLHRGRRYRLRLRNASDDIHPIHLHRHIFELTKIAGRPTSGVLKDVVMIGAYQEVEIDFTANSPGLSLFHCHMQLHMDYGFMALLDCR